MGVQEKFDQIGGIFARHEVPFQTGSQGDEYRVLVGSTAIFITVLESGGSTAIHMRSPVVMGIDSDNDDTMGRAYVIVNDLNRSNYFAKFCLYDDVIDAELDLFGDDLQASELMLGL